MLPTYISVRIIIVISTVPTTYVIIGIIVAVVILGVIIIVILVSVLIYKRRKCGKSKLII